MGCLYGTERCSGYDIQYIISFYASIIIIILDAYHIALYFILGTLTS
jgi:hypothetical protein